MYICPMPMFTVHAFMFKPFGWKMPTIENVGNRFKCAHEHELNSTLNAVKDNHITLSELNLICTK